MTSNVRQVSVADALAHARRLVAKYPRQAIEQAQAILRAEPRITETHFIIANAQRMLGEHDQALATERRGLAAAENDRLLERARSLVDGGKPLEARHLLALHLNDSPNDPPALRLMAKIAASLGELEHADTMLKRALSIAPSYEEAIADLWAVLAMKATACDTPRDKPATPPEGTQEFQSSLAAAEKAANQAPDNPKLWLSLGHYARIAGASDTAIAAYRRATAVRPTYGEAWWSLADLKTVELGDEEIGTIERALSQDSLSAADRIGLEFTLAKALGDREQYEAAFGHLAAGNAERRKQLAYNADALDAYVDEVLSIFTDDFFASRATFGRAGPGPIFIVGMPRSGSTLLEQILASHPQIEGTEELQFLTNLSTIVGRGAKAGLDRGDFVEAIASLTAEKSQVLAGAYLWNAERVRHSSRPYFIDKMPRNWLYIPLIRLLFPDAHVIDMRRDAMDCCWSNFTQLYADSGEFSYDLQELGQYYRSYERMMDVMRERLPDFVTIVRYEQLIEEPTETLTQLFGFLGIAFDPAILDFHANARAVKTSSSEQVRRPINQSGRNRWQPYASWLQPLVTALGYGAGGARH